VGQYAFVLDQSSCIGCHACTVACKVEHGVELGVFRTWVKYVERGEFPDTSRHFAVLRCNHCTDAPCVEICPVQRSTPTISTRSASRYASAVVRAFKRPGGLALDRPEVIDEISGHTGPQPGGGWS
jgi:ferredoxin